MPNEPQQSNHDLSALERQIRFNYYSIVSTNALAAISIIGLIFGAIGDRSYLGISFVALVASVVASAVLRKRATPVLAEYEESIDQLIGDFADSFCHFNGHVNSPSLQKEFETLNSHLERARRLANVVDRSDDHSHLDQSEAALYRTMISHLQDNPELQYSSTVAAMLDVPAAGRALAGLEDVGEIRRKRLQQAGLDSRLVLHRADINRITEVESVGPKTAQKIKDGLSPYPVLDQLESRLSDLFSRSQLDLGDVDTLIAEGGTPDPAHSVGTERSSEIESSSKTSKTSDNRDEGLSVEDSSATESTVRTELRTALESIQKAKSGNGSREELIRAHNYLCRALDSFDTTDTDLNREKIETAIARVEERLEGDPPDTGGVTSSTSANEYGEDTPETHKSPLADDSTDSQLDPDSSGPDRAELIAELRRLSDQQGGVVSRGSMWSMGSFDPGEYEDAFGSWEAALEKSGLLGDAEPASETHPENETELSAEETARSLDRPEGRVSSLEVIVQNIEEIEDTARDRELKIETAEGVSLPLVIWNEHEIDYEFETNDRYLLEQARYKTWETDDGAGSQLNSTSDLEITELDDQDWLTAIRVELYRYRLEQGDDVLQLDHLYRFCEHRLETKFPGSNDIRSKIGQTLERLRERAEVQSVDGEGAYHIIALDGFPGTRDQTSGRDQSFETDYQEGLETDSEADVQEPYADDDSSKTDTKSDGPSEPSQIDQFMDDLDL